MHPAEAEVETRGKVDSEFREQRLFIHTIEAVVILLRALDIEPAEQRVLLRRPPEHFVRTIEEQHIWIDGEIGRATAQGDGIDDPRQSRITTLLPD